MRAAARDVTSLPTRRQSGEARDRLASALAVERLRLDRLHPDPQAVLATVEHRMPGLWVGDDRLVVRLGVGETPTRVAWAENGTRSHPSAAGTPVTVALRDVGCLGVVGPDDLTHAVLRSVVGQLCAAHPPTRLVLAVASSSAEWSWSRWLPHLVDVAATPDAVGALADGGGGSGSSRGPPTFSSCPRGTPARPVRSCRPRGRRAGSSSWRHASGLPARWRGSVLVIRHGRTQVFEPASGPPVPVVPDLVGVWWSDRLARALAPLRCADPGSGRRVLPDAVGLTDLLGSAAADPAAMVEGWARAADRGGGLAPPAAVIGSGPRGSHAIDLSRDGPHVLVGGTTGSGKSEFLRTLVVSLAISTPPSDLTLVLVDFKGGAAFGPCADLPHVVGLVTDLDDHLVARALTLPARRAAPAGADARGAGVPDLEAYARSPHARQEPMPRLVVVVDELRTLVDEVPDFVSGLVRLAAQGRSLGIHLVLATQRPAGAVTAEVQANVSLRIAFRLRDRGRLRGRRRGRRGRRPARRDPGPGGGAGTGRAARDVPVGHPRAGESARATPASSR